MDNCGCSSLTRSGLFLLDVVQPHDHTFGFEKRLQVLIALNLSQFLLEHWLGIAKISQEWLADSWREFHELYVLESLVEIFYGRRHMLDYGLFGVIGDLTFREPFKL